jgi:hypothetical protein
MGHPVGYKGAGRGFRGWARVLEIGPWDGTAYLIRVLIPIPSDGSTGSGLSWNYPDTELSHIMCRGPELWPRKEVHP